MVGLLTAARDHDVGPLLQGVGQQVLELAQLVARSGARGHVVTLHPQLETHQSIECVVTPDRRRRVAQVQTFHEASTSRMTAPLSSVLGGCAPIALTTPATGEVSAFSIFMAS